jgi:hypothetical protein
MISSLGLHDGAVVPGVCRGDGESCNSVSSPLAPSPKLKRFKGESDGF